MSSKVTVVIPTYNRYKTMPDAVMSACEADEVIVSDDGSTDHTAEVMRDLGVTCVFNGHRGPVPTINAALELVTEGWIVHLSDDDVLMPGAVAAIRERDCDILVSQLAIMDDSGTFRGLWTYHDRQLDPAWLLRFAHETKTNPIPTLIYHSDFLRRNDLRWYEWDDARHSEDCITMLKWLKHEPRIEFLDYMTHGLRQHAGQETNDTQARQDYVAALDRYFEGEA